MNYTVETRIEKPMDEVVRLYNDPSYYATWMPGIQRYRITAGRYREAGSKAIFSFKMEGREFNIEETVLKNEGNKIVAEYLAKGTRNTQTTMFVEIDAESTRYTVNESFHLKGFMKVIGLLMPGAFKKQTQRFVTAFKNFAEQYGISQ